jgi:ankyrin repeat protein
LKKSSRLIGLTALIDKRSVSTLVKAGVDINVKDNKNKSALDYAIIMNDDLLIELLKNKNKKL